MYMIVDMLRETFYRLNVVTCAKWMKTMQNAAKRYVSDPMDSVAAGMWRNYVVSRSIMDVMAFNFVCTCSIKQGASMYAIYTP